MSLQATAAETPPSSWGPRSRASLRTAWSCRRSSSSGVQRRVLRSRGSRNRKLLVAWRAGEARSEE